MHVANINVHTIGHNTFHKMGITQINTPKSSVLPEESISLTNQVFSAKDFAEKDHIPIQIY